MILGNTLAIVVAIEVGAVVAADVEVTLTGIRVTVDDTGAAAYVKAVVPVPTCAGAGVESITVAGVLVVDTLGVDTIIGVGADTIGVDTLVGDAGDACADTRVV